MLKMIIYFLVLSISWTAFAEANLGVCQSPDTQLAIAKVVQSEKNELSSNNFGKMISDRKVLLAGEAHFYTDTAALVNLISMYAQLRGTKACVAFEFSQKAVSGEAMLNKIRVGIPELRAALADSNFSDDDRKAVVDQITNFEEILRYYDPLVAASSKHGLKTVAIDHPDHPFVEAKSDDDRNKAMADEIVRLIDSKSCDSVLAFVGKAHLSRAFGNVTRIQDLMATPNNQIAITLNLQMTSETIPVSGRTWTNCEPPQLSKPLLFQTSVISNEVNIMPNIPKSPLWTDYDFTLMLP